MLVLLLTVNWTVPARAQTYAASQALIGTNPLSMNTCSGSTVHTTYAWTMPPANTSSISARLLASITPRTPSC